MNMLLASARGYLFLYQATGKECYLRAVKGILAILKEAIVYFQTI
jgi:hypothetical protein